MPTGLRLVEDPSATKVENGARCSVSGKVLFLRESAKHDVTLT